MMLNGEVYDTGRDHVVIRTSPGEKLPVSVGDRVVVMPAGQAWMLWSASLIALTAVLIIGLASVLTPSPAPSKPAIQTATVTVSNGHTG